MALYAALNEFVFIDTNTPYVGLYILLRGKYYAGRTYIVGKSRLIKKTELSTIDRLMHPYAYIHIPFLNSILIEDIKYISHPRLDLLGKSMILIYILKDLKTGYLYDITRESYILLLKKLLFRFSLNKIKLKCNFYTTENILYNNRQLARILDKSVVEFIRRLYKI